MGNYLISSFLNVGRWPLPDACLAQQSALWISPTTPNSLYVIRPHYIAKAEDDCGYLRLNSCWPFPPLSFRCCSNFHVKNIQHEIYFTDLNSSYSVKVEVNFITYFELKYKSVFCETHCFAQIWVQVDLNLWVTGYKCQTRGVSYTAVFLVIYFSCMTKGQTYRRLFQICYSRNI